MTRQFPTANGGLFSEEQTGWVLDFRLLIESNPPSQAPVNQETRGCSGEINRNVIRRRGARQNEGLMKFIQDSVTPRKHEG